MITDVLELLTNLTETPGVLKNTFDKLEKATGIKRTFLLYGALVVVGLWLAIGYGAQLLCNLIGFLYPAYYSLKALESKDGKDDAQWLTYWVVFALFSVLEFFSDIILGWIPFYWLIKCLLLLWTMSCNGSSLLYEKFVRPAFRNVEHRVDDLLNKGKMEVNKIAESAIGTAKEMAIRAQERKHD